MAPFDQQSCQLARKQLLLTLAGLLFIVSLSVVSASYAQNLQNLVLTNADGQILYSHPVNNGSSFAIQYTHSVAQTPVTDYFIIKNDEIWLDRTVYHDFGAGLPHSPENGQKLTQKHGQLVLEGYNQRLPQFTLRIGRVAGHKLLIFKQNPANNQEITDVEIPLNKLAKAGSCITFSVEKPASKQ